MDSLPDTAGDIRGQWRLQSKQFIKTPLLETNTNTFIEIVIRLHLENFNTWLKKGDIIKDEWFFKLWNNDIDIEEYDWWVARFILRMLVL
ncbi:hypothetical protein BSPWISOXPB_4423 [uncultured Gammaproteobacteria bacterium]|nr:hypothetical protein BSPWISOXPB_4423 [uncultured Gammaproteobacteria bacterium]